MLTCNSNTNYNVAHTHGNVHVDPESLVAVLDRRKSTFVSVDAISRTALNVRVDLERSAVVLDRMKRTIVASDRLKN
jgi:hypothetical protein